MFDPTSDKTIGYHLFVEPSGPLADELKAAIDGLAEAHGGPKFDPHVTVTARIPDGNDNLVIAKTRELVAGCKPFSLTLGELGSENAYFRALYIKVEPSEALEALHARADEIFSLTSASPYLPHLSLLYGNFPQSKKDEIILSLLHPQGESFLVDRIHLYRTEGGTESWQKMQEFIFQ